MIRIKPEQDVTKRKIGVFRVFNFFKSYFFHIILSVCVCVCACIVDVSGSPIYCCGSAFWIILFDIIRKQFLWSHKCIHVGLCTLSMCQCHQFIFVVVLYFSLFYFKRPCIEN